MKYVLVVSIDELSISNDCAGCKCATPAANHCQIEALGLMPWQSPPRFATMSALDQPYGDAGAKRELAELALRMQRQGVSRWHPDPARECERIEAEPSPTLPKITATKTQ